MLKCKAYILQFQEPESQFGNSEESAEYFIGYSYFLNFKLFKLYHPPLNYTLNVLKPLIWTTCFNLFVILAIFPFDPFSVPCVSNIISF